MLLPSFEPKLQTYAVCAMTKDNITQQTVTANVAASIALCADDPDSLAGLAGKEERGRFRDIRSQDRPSQR
jgi:hypothetical protein